MVILCHHHHHGYWGGGGGGHGTEPLMLPCDLRTGQQCLFADAEDKDNL